MMNTVTNLQTPKFGNAYRRFQGEWFDISKRGAPQVSKAEVAKDFRENGGQAYTVNAPFSFQKTPQYTFVEYVPNFALITTGLEQRALVDKGETEVSDQVQKWFRNGGLYIHSVPRLTPVSLDTYI